MNIKDFKVGQIVYVELFGSAKRRRKPGECIEEWEITRVGRKYLKARKRESVFSFEEIFEQSENSGLFVQKTSYGINYILYKTREEIEDKWERCRLRVEILSIFNGHTPGISQVSLGQLRRIKGILEESEGKEE